MFYEERLTKSQIAKALEVSNTHVKRLLDEALKRGIVRIAVVENPHFAHIEKALEARFHLRVARVASATDDYEHQKEALGHVAAELFEELVTVGTRVGIGGGGSLKAMVDALPVQPREIQIAPMALVGRGPRLEHVDSAFLASLLYYKSAPKAKAVVVGMPPIPRNPDARAAFIDIVEKEIPEVAAVLAEARLSTVAFVGLGGPGTIPELVSALHRSDTSHQQQIRAAGGVNYTYFDTEGNNLGQFFTSMPLNHLQTMAADPGKILVIVAGGAHKVQSLQIAFRAGFANSLVTDEKTALRLMDASPEQRHSAVHRGGR
jgi:deoxyribonucleoside regulator